MKVGDRVRIKKEVDTFGGNEGDLVDIGPDWQSLRFHVLLKLRGVENLPVRFALEELEVVE